MVTGPNPKNTTYDAQRELEELNKKIEALVEWQKKILEKPVDKDAVIRDALQTLSVTENIHDT